MTISQESNSTSAEETFQLWLLKEVEQRGGQIADTRQLKSASGEPLDPQHVLGALNSLQSRHVKSWWRKSWAYF